MLNYNGLSLRNKMLVPLLPAILLFFVLLGIYASSEIKKALYNEMSNQLQVNIRLLSDLITTINTATINDANQQTSYFFKQCGGANGFALNPGLTVKIGDQNTPTMTLRGKLINLDESLVDEFSGAYPGSVATIFARSGEDFVRVATSLKKENGSRAVGTLMGDKNPAYQKVLHGETYHGIAKLFGSWYMTKYTPIKQDNQVIGVLFVGRNINVDLEEFTKSAKKIKVGTTGYIFVLDAGLSSNRGTFLLHPTAAMMGKNVIDTKDANGKLLFKEMLDKREGVINYSWQNKELGENSPREKLAFFTTENPWNWQIAASAYSGELFGAAIRIKWVLIAAAVVCALLLAGLVALILHKTLAPLKETSQAIEKMSQGDLTVCIEVASGDEIGKIQCDINNMVAHITGIIRQTSQTSLKVAAASTQLQSTAMQIATGAEEVAAQTSTVAVASEEMAATSGDIAQNCQLAADSSNQASATARSGAAVVEETITGMERIASRVRNAARTVVDLGSRSEQIGAIIGTIEDIADQTNLLALNAAIEAARAGEQGRGFAVVADEVRALAERTTRATREIGEMIKAIQTETKGAVAAMEEGVAEVEKGTESSLKSGQALEMILSQINDVSMQVNQIATAAEEQTATTNEITSNVHQVTEVVQQTARGAAETSAASTELSQHAAELQRLVGQFKL